MREEEEVYLDLHETSAGVKEVDIQGEERGETKDGNFHAKAKQVHRQSSTMAAL